MKCPLCNTNTKSFFHPTKDMSFYKCPNCELVIKHKKHFIHADDEKKRYETHNNSINDLGYVNFLQSFIDYAISPFLSCGSIIDYGSGPVPVMQELLIQQGYEVDIYDPFFQPVLSNKIYDMLISTEVLEHIHDPLKSLQDIDRLVKPLGYIGFMTLFQPKEKDQFFNWFYIRDETHVMFYTPKTCEIIAHIMSWELIKHNDNRMVIFRKKMNK